MSTRRSLIAVAAVALALLWLSGSLDEPLSSVGLNRNTCAENLFGSKICGDDLTEFCRQRYNPSGNAGTCDGVLRDAGYDPAEIAGEERRARRAYEQCIDSETDAAIRENRSPSFDLCDPP